MEGDVYYAHSANAQGVRQPLAEHLRNVAELAAEFAEPFGGGFAADLAGRVHDAGKASDLFLRRLRGAAAGLDHWSPGACLLLQAYRDVAGALAVQGHHMGLQRGDAASLRALHLPRLAESHPLGLRLTEVDVGALLGRLQQMGVAPASQPAATVPLAATCAAMLDQRMLFSALVDADFLDTARHFGEGRPSGPALDAAGAYSVTEACVRALGARGASSPTIQALRDDLWRQCVAAADGGPGLWTLAAPTGAGKTLAMAGFAFRHAAANGLRRVILVIPYLTILDQTAHVLRAMLEPAFGPGVVVEHHSLAGTGPEPPADGEPDAEGEARRRERLLAENWDAPVILTTSVQFLESLFSNRPGACRKLHRIAGSVVLFDEVQTLPLPLIVSTLAALSHLSDRYRASVVFSTATQPAFEHLHEPVRALGAPGWQPRSAAGGGLFGRVRRVRVRWPETDERMDWDDVADRMERQGQALCIVNLKRHARDLAGLLRERGAANLYHLSTSMCPAHRRRVLRWVRRHLRRCEPCLLVATSCVEAGVDVDFPFGMRAFGDLCSVAQAAGRVNRNGLRERGDLVVFRPAAEGTLYPPGGFEQAAGVTGTMLSELGASAMDIDDPALFSEYYRRLCDVARPEEQRRELAAAICAQDYVRVAELYHLIPRGALNVLVPYNRLPRRVAALTGEVRERGLTADWIRRARPYTIGLLCGREDAARAYMHPVTIGRGKEQREVPDWRLYWEGNHYDPLLGLVPPPDSVSWLA